jgi:hypothetical protein
MPNYLIQNDHSLNIAAGQKIESTEELIARV